MKSEEKRPFGRDDRKAVIIELLMIKEKCPFVGHESTWWSGDLGSLIINSGARKKVNGQLHARPGPPVPAD